MQFVTRPFNKSPAESKSAAKSAGLPAVDKNCNAADIATHLAAEVGGEVGGVKELASGLPSLVSLSSPLAKLVQCLSNVLCK